MLDTFLPGKLTAWWVLEQMQEEYPHANLTYVSNPHTGMRYKDDAVIPDGATVHVLSEQPVDA